jgi:serine/threonine protein kinase
MTEERLNDLLLAWQEQHGQDRDVSAAELCRDCPELAGELARRIDVLRQMTRLVEAVGAREATWRQPSLPAAPSLLPSSVPGYEILQELGRGGMGVVYQARQVKLDRLVALKMILAAPQSADLERFRTEGGAVARLRHPNIVQIYEVGDHAGRPYLVLEHVEGGSLAEKLNGAPLPPREAAALLLPLADAVQHAHQAGILHRDLKPANVLLSTVGKASSPVSAEEDRRERLSYVPKITDFGLAKRLDVEGGHTQTGSVLGTPSYMAPEQAEGRLADAGPATDVYALGATLYEMLTGRPPFTGTTVLEILEHVRTLDPVPPRALQPGVPRDLEVICLKCLQKRPADRYDSAATLAEDLQNFLAGEAIRARPLNLLDHFRRQLSRKDVGAFANVRSHGLAQICLAPIPFLILLAVHALYHDTRHYAVVITAVSTAILVLAEGIGLVVGWRALRSAHPRLRRHWVACLGAEMAGTLIVWLLLLQAAPADHPEVLFLVYPLWLVRAGALNLGWAADFGMLYLVGMVFFLVAVAAAFFLPWMPLVFGVLIWLMMTLEGALKLWTRVYTATP